MATFTIYAEKDKSFPLVYKDANKVVIDVTGYTARLMVRKSPYGTALITKNATVDGPNGMFTFDFVPADTAGILTNEEFVKYIYDVEYTDAGGKKDILLSGDVIIKQPITRD